MATNIKEKELPMVKKYSFLLTLIFINLSITSATTIEGKTVTASESMVVTRHFLATEIGNDILMSGGNAIDASVAVSFALSVVLPQASPLGGGGFMMIHDSASGIDYALDYREMAPAKATEDMFVVNDEVNRELALESYLSSGVPGTVYGLYMAHQKFGNLPWKKLIEPSILIAEKGFKITETLAKSLETNSLKLAKRSSTKEIFFKDG